MKKADTGSNRRTRTDGNVFQDLGFSRGKAKRLLAHADARIDGRRCKRASVRTTKKAGAKAAPLSSSHRDWLIKELQADRKLAVGYLNAAAEDEDPRVYLSVLRTVAEAQGMAKVAKAAGISRESLYRALSPAGNPRLSILHAILRAACLRMTVVSN
jgi:probable addiction module antidote protein